MRRFLVNLCLGILLRLTDSWSICGDIAEDSFEDLPKYIPKDQYVHKYHFAMLDTEGLTRDQARSFRKWSTRWTEEDKAEYKKFLAFLGYASEKEFKLRVQQENRDAKRRRRTGLEVLK